MDGYPRHRREPAVETREYQGSDKRGGSCSFLWFGRQPSASTHFINFHKTLIIFLKKIIIKIIEYSFGLCLYHIMSLYNPLGYKHYVGINCRTV